MKRFKLLSLLSMALLVCMNTILISCGDDDDPELSVFGTPAIEASGAVSGEIAVTAVNTDWSVTVTTGNDWLSAYKNGNKVSLQAKENTITASRNATIVITATANTSLSYTISVTQAGASSYLNLNPTSISLTAGKDVTGSFTIDTNVSWTASCDASWLTLSSKSGSSGKTAITVTTTEANQTGYTRTATINIAGTGVDNKIITVEQRSDVKAIKMEISDPLTLTTSAAFKLTPVGNVYRFYFGYLNADYIGASDEQILSALLQEQGQEASATTLYGINELNSNTEYILCSVAYDQSSNRGPIERKIIKTKASVTNRADVTFSNVTYDDSYWHWSTTIGPFATKYYMLSASGYTAYKYITECNLAMLAWYIKEDVESGSSTAIVQNGSWKLSRSSSDMYFLSAAWAVDANGNWSPEVDGTAGSISSSSKSLTKVKNKVGKTPNIFHIDFNDFMKLTAKSVMSYK